MHEIEFTKMHGLGNDFVVICKDQLNDINDLNDFARRISDRRFGIGCDQVILYDGSGHNYNMYIYNQNGSSAGACGNGTRCLVRLIGLPKVTINVSGRVLDCDLVDDDIVTVNMGPVKYDESWMPKEHVLWELVKCYQIEPIDVICIDVGNPHIVIFKTDLSHSDKALIGSILEVHPIFKNGVNVNFADVKNGSIKLQVWERGDGFTLACGSGACASFVAAKKKGFVDNTAVVKFQYGDLNMSTQGQDVLMTGSTKTVAIGTYFY